jgi:hypothetical protein
MNEILLVNPRKRRKGKKARRSRSRGRGRVRLKSRSARRRRIHRVKARRFKRNPSARGAGFGLSVKGITGAIVPTLKGGALGAVGAIANDALIGQISKLSFLPDALRSGYGRHALKFGSAILVGTIGNLAMRGKGAAFATGAATVAIHGFIREVVAANMPEAAKYLGDYEELDGYNPGQIVDGSADNVGEYVPGFVGEYVPGFVGDSGDDFG